MIITYLAVHLVAKLYRLTYQTTMHSSTWINTAMVTEEPLIIYTFILINRY
jgi:hypothetical protein